MSRRNSRDGGKGEKNFWLSVRSVSSGIEGIVWD